MTRFGLPGLRNEGGNEQSEGDWFFDSSLLGTVIVLPTTVQDKIYSLDLTAVNLRWPPVLSRGEFGLPITASR